MLTVELSKTPEAAATFIASFIANSGKELQRVLRRQVTSYLLHSDPEQPTKTKDRVGIRLKCIPSQTQPKSQALFENVTNCPP